MTVAYHVHVYSYAGCTLALPRAGKMGGGDELWLDIRQLPVLQQLMGARIDLAAKNGCDGLEPDNTDVSRACLCAALCPPRYVRCMCGVSAFYVRCKCVVCAV